MKKQINSTAGDLIANLVAEAEPIGSQMSNRVKFAIWCVISIFSISFGLFLVGLRYDFSTTAFSANFLLESLFALAAAVLAAGGAFAMSIPSENNSRLSKWTFLPLFAWFGVIIYQWFAGDFSFMVGLQGFACTGEVIALGILPGLTLLYLIKKAAPVNLGQTGFFSMIAVFASGAMGVKFTCYFDHPVHLIAAHYLPIFGLGLLGYWLGKWILKW